MHITCPACEAAFDVPDHLIGDTGRTVKCAKCAHQWYQHAQVEDVSEDEIAALIAAEPEPQPGSAATEDNEPNWQEIKGAGFSKDEQGEAKLVEGERRGGRKDDMKLVDDTKDNKKPDPKLVTDEKPKKEDTPEQSGDDPADLDAIAALLEDDDDIEDEGANAETQEDGEEFDAFADMTDEDEGAPPEDAAPKEEEKPEEDVPPVDNDSEDDRDTQATLASLLGLLPSLLVGLAGLVVVGGITVFFLARETVVELWPPFAGVYEALDMAPETVQTLRLGPISARMEEEAGAPVMIVTGLINNPTGTEQPIPQLRLTLFDANNDVVQELSAPPPTETAEPRSMIEYQIRLPEPDPQAARFQVFWQR